MSDSLEDFWYVSAQNDGDAGTVTVAIYDYGEKLKESTSEGAYVIAEADYSFGY